MKKIIYTIVLSTSLFVVQAQNKLESTGNVGIGTTTPAYPLSVKPQTDGTAIQFTSGSSLYSGYHLDIGNNPYEPWGRIYSISTNAARLDITAGDRMFLFAHDIYFQGNPVVTRKGDPSSLATQKSSNTMPFEANLWNGSAGVLTYAGIQNIASSTVQGAHRIAIKVDASNTDLSDGREILSILSDSSVGIGTSNTNHYRLAVNGPAIFTKAVVKSNIWADYVFHPSYKLPSLHEVESYIKSNQHLPEIPTTADVEKDGINLGDNQVLLLKKVEELTLYLIDQNKRLEEQQREINLLKKQLIPKFCN